MATTITGTIISPGTDPELNLCRVSGYLRDVGGVPLRGQAITVRHIYNPIGIAPDTLVLSERKVYRTDKDGYVQFDLLQGALVDFELPNRLADHVLHRLVPSVVSIDLVDLFFPYILAIEFVTTTPQALEVGDTLTIAAVALLSNGETVVLASTSTTLESSDEEVLERTSGFLFTALTPGSILISMTDFDPEPLKLLLEPDGDAIYIQAQPALAFPDDIVVVVS